MKQASPIILHSGGVGQTLALGKALGRLAAPNTCLALFGNLGAGKTQLARGIAAGAGVDDPTLVSSPTYVLLNIYRGKKPVFHLDAYRLGGEADFEAVGLEELLRSGGVTVIEWPERIVRLLPAERLDIALDAGAKRNHRELTLTAHGSAAELLAGELAAAWKQSHP